MKKEITKYTYKHKPSNQWIVVENPYTHGQIFLTKEINHATLFFEPEGAKFCLRHAQNMGGDSEKDINDFQLCEVKVDYETEEVK